MVLGARVTDDDEFEDQNKKGNNIRYPVIPEIQRRTHKDQIEYVKEYLATGNVCKGVKGVSPMFGFPGVDVINSFPVDDLHCCYIGVNYLLLELWLSSVYHKQLFYIGLRWAEINQSLLRITPPGNFARLPRSILDYKFWKGNEHRSWMFFYAIPSLINILPARYLLHYKLFVEAVYILSKRSIKSSELERADVNLKAFVGDFERLYGTMKMVYNVHQLSHLVDSVKETGPLWATSTFHFESNNGKLISFVHGTKDVVKQIFTKYSLSETLKEEKTPTILKYLNLINCKTHFKSFKRIENTILAGKGNIFEANEKEIELLGNNQEWLCHKKMIHSNEYYSYENSSIQTNDSFVKLNSGEFGVIVKIVSKGQSAAIIMRQLNVLPDPILNCYHLKSYVISDHYKLVNVKNIVQKCICIKTKKFSYISEFPNKIQKY